MNIQMTIDMGSLGEQEIEFEVHYSPGTPDVMYLPNGDPGYPGDPAEIDIQSMKVKVIKWTRGTGRHEEWLDISDLIEELSETVQEKLMEKASESYSEEQFEPEPEHYENGF